MSVGRWSHIKGVFAGAGSDGLNQPAICRAIISLSKKEKPTVLYLGTATYDLPSSRHRQTCLFAEAGCEIQSLEIAQKNPPNNMCEVVDGADVIIVSGGNTLYAIDRWKQIQLDNLLNKAMQRGAVLTGGSAGAICWFDGGHSDSMDPDTYQKAMCKQLTGGGDESSAAPGEQEEAKKWEYIRVPGLGFLPGLICPHNDKIQSNGVLRATDFDGMMRRHPGERGICIDHWAALLVNEGNYEVISLEEKEGSVLEDGSFSPTRQGKPGVWIKDVVNGQVKTTNPPSSGKIENILKEATKIEEDERCDECRKKNPLP